MNTGPRAIDDLDAFAAAYSVAWTKDPAGLLDFFDRAGSYTDMDMGTTYEGHDGILRKWSCSFGRRLDDLDTSHLEGISA